MAELVDQAALRVTGGMVVMQGTRGGCLLRGGLGAVVMGAVVLGQHPDKDFGLRLSAKTLRTGRAMRHAVVQAQGLRQQQSQAERAGSANGHRKMDHLKSVAGLSMAKVWALLHVTDRML